MPIKAMGYMKSENSSCNETNLYGRMKKLLVSYEWSDCSFCISDTRFKAHKLILGISSPVFEAMFYGPLANTNDIVITDIQPDTFQLVLNYIYTDKVEISSIEQAFELLYASRKYMLEYLSELCIAFIQANISIDNVIDILNLPIYMQDEQLITYSLKLFCEHANYLLEENKLSITYSCMKAILESDQMNIEEKHLIKHVFEWSTHYCDQNSLPSSVENRRSILQSKGLFQLLRFLSLTLNDLEEICTDVSNLLLPDEYENIKAQIMLENSNECKEITEMVGTSTLPRNPLKLQWYLCYRSPLRSMAPIVIDFDNYIIQSRIKCNKSVFINSLCVPTQMAPAGCFRNNVAKVYSEQLSVSISSETDNSIIKYTNFMNTVEYDSIVDIELTEPCFIKKDQWYKISFVWPENIFPTYSYIVEYRDKNYTGHNVTFEFDDLPFSTGNSGSFLGGLKFCL